MKQVIFYKTGYPQDVLKVEEAEVPVPKSGEVLIRITARNINPSDIMFVRGMYGIAPQLPSSAGFEAVGVVEDAGDQDRINRGTRVIFSAIGTWKEYICLPANQLIPAPEGMPDEVACQAFINPMTAYGMLQRSGLQEGDWLLLTAGASAFSKLVIQMAKAKGIKIACTVRRKEQIAQLTDRGVDLVVNTETEKIPNALMDATNGDGVSVVFDAVGGSLGAKALASLKPKGKMMVYGLLSLENIPLNSGLMIFKDLSIEGFWLTSYLEGLDKKSRQEAFHTVFGTLTSQDLKVDVADTFPLDQVKEAIAAYEKPGRTGKIILVS
ncbi:zinc-dependent alcohol dehydrogenase family protein [Lunatibacter salilacus]|uniref:zinc-dependent alcohol dehydrogenase family protein n=1 Tax=Lunatibacter salilacus TaxID=2483804 RepID=UPI00131DEED9|nr:zinc-dependent alcohol dehydrogenase family protein [Lunatibacter salilacus]